MLFCIRSFFGKLQECTFMVRIDLSPVDPIIYIFLCKIEVMMDIRDCASKKNLALTFYFSCFLDCKINISSLQL